MTFIQFLSYKIIVIKAIRFIFNLFVVTFNILSTGFVLFYMVPIKTSVHKHMSTKWQRDKKQKEFEVTKRAIRIRISKKNRQHNGQNKKDKRTNNDLQNIHIKLKKGSKIPTQKNKD